MKRVRRFSPFKRILIPVIHGGDPATVLRAARLMIGHGTILLVGLVKVKKGKSLSTAAGAARQIRRILRESYEGSITSRMLVRVSHDPWEDLNSIIEEEQADLLLLEWPKGFKTLGVTAKEVLTNPPCDTVLVRGPVPERPTDILIPIRGGPHAELALRVSLAISRSASSRITSLHLVPSDHGKNDRRDAPFQGISRILSRLKEIRRLQRATDDPAGTIIRDSADFKMIVMGATARPKDSPASLGPVAERILAKSSSCVLAVKSKRVEEPGSHTAGQRAISILVDKWFSENTFHAEEFKNLQELVALKKERKVTISVALPALNEQATVGRVIRTMKHALMERFPLVDEIVLIDSSSTDRTCEIARACGVPVFLHQELLPRYGVRSGKGEALWKSLFVTRGDLILWIDTDIVNPHPRLIYGLIGTLLHSPQIRFVKGFYRRPLRVGDKIQAGGGGRVTELVARPFLNLFYPELSGIIQPLSGEYGGRRELLERLTFYSGYGVEIGLLIDVLEKAGLDAIAQVDLKERIHRNQPLEPLSMMSFAIIQTIIAKLEKRLGHNLLEDLNKTMKLIRYEPPRFFLDIQEIAEMERPPMTKLPEYRKVHR